jgi:type II secretory pathway pseudopilin PulG
MPEGGGNFLTNKIGPFPGYVWVGGGTAIVLLLRARSGGQSSSQQQAQAAQQAQLQAQQQAMAASAAYPTYQQSGQPLYILPTGSTGPGSPVTTTPAATVPGKPDALTPGSSGYFYSGGTQYRYIEATPGETQAQVAQQFWGPSAGTPAAVSVLQHYNPNVSGVTPVFTAPTAPGPVFTGSVPAILGG